jgi:hypothetical protein
LLEEILRAHDRQKQLLGGFESLLVRSSQRVFYQTAIASPTFQASLVALPDRAERVAVAVPQASVRRR